MKIIEYTLEPEAYGSNNELVEYLLNIKLNRPFRIEKRP